MGQLAQSEQFQLVFDPRHLAAAVVARPGTDLSRLEREHIAARLHAANITITDRVDLRIREFVGLCHDRRVPQAPFVLARGTPPSVSQPARIVLDVEWQTSFSPDPSANGETALTAPMIRRGQIIGRFEIEKLGVPGTNVHGEPIAPPPPESANVIGPGCAAPDADGIVRADADGRLVFEAGRASVVAVDTLEGDFAGDGRSHRAKRDLHLTGSVGSGVTLETGGRLEVAGAVECATLTSAGDLLIRGGVTGHGKARIVAGGRFAAKFCDGADIRARQDVFISREVLHCTIRTPARARLQEASVVGGQIHANAGIELAVVGNSGGVATQLSTGTAPEVLAKVREIDGAIGKLDAAVQRARSLLAPLAANMRRLRAADRERATELQFQVDALDAELKTRATERERLLSADGTAAPGPIVVSRQIHAGVTIAVGNLATVFSKGISGPIRIERATGKSHPVLTLVDMSVDPPRTTALPCREFLG